MERKRSLEEWEEIIRRCHSECEATGKSRAKWIEENNVEQTSFFRYQRRFGLTSKRKPEPARSEAVVIPFAPSRATITQDMNYPVMITVANGCITIGLSNGISEHLAECIGRVIRNAL